LKNGIRANAATARVAEFARMPLFNGLLGTYRALATIRANEVVDAAE
jgi:hypothetical protein